MLRNLWSSVCTQVFSTVSQLCIRSGCLYSPTGRTPKFGIRRAFQLRFLYHFHNFNVSEVSQLLSISVTPSGVSTLQFSLIVPLTYDSCEHARQRWLLSLPFSCLLSSDSISKSDVASIPLSISILNTSLHSRLLDILHGTP